MTATIAPEVCASPMLLPSHRSPALVASLCLQALRDEAELTPKPGLVDRRGGGAHTDMNIGLLRLSIAALEPGFLAMTHAAQHRLVSVSLREQLARIGREAEQQMLAATRGVNTHRGAIWALGLLACASVIDSACEAQAIAHVAAAIARLPDRWAPTARSHGKEAIAQFGGGGAYGEACAAFPHVTKYGLPQLRRSRLAGAVESVARLDALLAIMSHLPDTCLLHRGGSAALKAAQHGAARVLAVGGMATSEGVRAMQALDKDLFSLRASPGGSADLLAATLFLDRLQTARDMNPRRAK